MGQVTKVQLSCYLVLRSNNSKIREQDSRTFVTWPIYINVYILFIQPVYYISYEIKKRNISKFLFQGTPTYLMVLWLTTIQILAWWQQNSVRRLTKSCDHANFIATGGFHLVEDNFHRNLSKMTTSGTNSDENFIYQLNLTERKFHQYDVSVSVRLTHWGRVTHICVENLTTIGSDNGLSPGRRQAIIWTNAGILLIGPSGINFNEIFIEILAFSFRKMHSKMLFGKWRPFCLGLNVLILYSMFFPYCLQGTDNPSHNLHKGVTYTTCKST